MALALKLLQDSNPLPDDPSATTDYQKQVANDLLYQELLLKGDFMLLRVIDLQDF